MIDPIVIGIGYKKGSGKDTIANRLVDNHNFIKLSFADPLKQACKSIFHFTDDQLYGNSKEIVDPNWGKTPREILQIIGTDAIRSVSYNDVWIRSTFIKMDKLVKEFPDKQLRFVIPDVRFKNEVLAIKNLSNSSLWKVNRNLPSNAFSTHISETELDDCKDWDYEFDNNFNMQSLYSSIDKTMKLLTESKKDQNEFNRRKA